MTPDPTPSDLRLCVAPMMDWTDRHCRRLHRALSRRARLYTEMLTADRPGYIVYEDEYQVLAEPFRGEQ